MSHLTVVATPWRRSQAKPPMEHHVAPYRSGRPTEVPFGPGALSVCPFGGFEEPRDSLLLVGGVSPRGPPGDKH
eukprot:4414327-Heterocapsa_arctica.AAC.1